MRAAGNPVVTVVMPVRDGEAYIDEAIDSVLSQGYGAVEVVVVDDGSEDSSAARARSRDGAVRVVSTPPRGAWHAVNRGVSEARAPLLAFLDADDRWSPDSLGARVAVLDEQRDTEAVAGHVVPFHSPDLTAQERARYQAATGRIAGLVLGALLIRRPAFDRIGPLNPSQGLGAIMDWWQRAAAAQLRWQMIDDTVLERRIHRANRTLAIPNLTADYAPALKAMLDRRRASGGEGA